MPPKFDIKKPYDEYGGGPVALVWQGDVLYDKSGKVLPKDYNHLITHGYRVPKSLRIRLRTYAEYSAMNREIAKMKAEAEARIKAREQELRTQIDMLARAEELQSKIQENPNFLDTEEKPTPVPANLFPLEMEAQEYLHETEPDGVPEEEEVSEESLQLPPIPVPQSAPISIPKRRR